ncbi:MAG: hypothetical protein RMJ07_01540 [Nitrososphaerota archaeon]|nr:hypothetical protein [Candidatus Bathyarchaeota archaeon]MDW8048352.1 hypothetical protein [Nitrososphaerota archaeon]
MPFTTYHLGLAFLIGYFLRRRLNWFALILSSVIIVLEPLIVMVMGLDYPVHRLLHTFLGSILVGALVGFVVYSFREYLTPIL